MPNDSLIDIAGFVRVLRHLIHNGQDAKAQEWLDHALVGDRWIGWRQDAHDRVRYELNEL